MTSTLRTVTASLLGFMILAGAGCTGSRTTALKAFSSDFSCPKNQLQIERPDKNEHKVYRVTGCNRRVTYRCSGDYGELCERVGEPEAITPSGVIDLPPKGEGKRAKTNDGTPPNP